MKLNVVCFSFTLHFIKPYLKNWVFTYRENLSSFQCIDFFSSFASHMTASLFIAVSYSLQDNIMQLLIFFLHKTLPLGQGTESIGVYLS